VRTALIIAAISSLLPSPEIVKLKAGMTVLVGSFDEI
jgi:hypothetical protein